MNRRDLRVVGVVLAAGRSSRMGRPKALLPAGRDGDTFVSRTSRTLLSGGVQDVLVVGRPDDDALRAAVTGLAARVRYVENPHAERGQLSSLRAGLEQAAASGADAVLVMPVDVPCVRTETIAAVLAAAATSACAIVRATHNGQHGHPVLFRAAVFDEVRRANPDVGAKEVVRADPGRVLDLEVEDPGVLRDVDRPSDYVELFGEVPGTGGKGV